MRTRIKKRYFILSLSIFFSWVIFFSGRFNPLWKVIPRGSWHFLGQSFFLGDGCAAEAGTFSFLLIHIHFILSAILLYLIIRHSIKLYIERSRRVPGSVFKRNLFFAFIVFSVIPVMFIFFIAGKLITTSIDNWFKIRIGTGLENGIVLHEEQTKRDRILIDESGKKLVNFIGSLGSPGDGESFQDFVAKNIKTFMKNGVVGKIYLWEMNGDNFFGSINDEAKVWNRFIAEGFSANYYSKKAYKSVLRRLQKTFLKKLQSLGRENDMVLQFDFYGSFYWVKPVQVPLFSEKLFLILVHRYPKKIRSSLIQVQKSIDDYRQLRSIKNPLYWNYLLTFMLITLLILFLSIWCAFFLARGISKPIQELLLAIRKVRQGDLDVRVKTSPQDDLKPLVGGFNEMTGSLQRAYKRLDFHNKEMFMMLEHIKESVFFISNFGRILSFNGAAKKLVEKYLGITRFKNKKINFLGEYVKKLFFSMVRDLKKTEKKRFSREISFSHDGEEKNFVIYVDVVQSVVLPANGGLNRPVDGILVVVDDLSDVYKMNKIKTWQEAAKQIAHEIKNPLTPIQLATQRLQRKLRKMGHDDPALMDCADTILQQVKIIKDLVAHFSEFARMPDSKIESLDINSIVREVSALYEMSYPKISISCDLKKFLPFLKADRKKMKRVFVNLLDNSVRALQKSDQKDAPCIEIKTNFKTGRNQLEIVISDNGPGIPKDVCEKLFLPYVSTGNKNMGLGLAIVHDIVTQIGGSIKLLKSPYGATFQILIPV